MRKRILSIVLGIFFLASALPGLTQAFNKDKLDSVFTALEKNDRFMGGIALMRNGQLIYTRNTGYSDLDAKKKPDENTKYRIGSITKTFTTVLIMKAKEEGKINLDQPIDKYFPNLANAKKITIRQLLSHRSGVHSFTNDSSYLSWYTSPKTRAELEKIITGSPSDFEPGTKAAYSNSGFVLLGFILEDLYGKSYANLIDERIVQPLALSNTRVGGRINTNANEAKSYVYKSAWALEKETDMSIPAGAGSIVSTPADLVKFADGLFTGKLVSAASLEEMKTLTDNFGLGLMRFPFYDIWHYGHGGNIDAFASLFSYDPENKVAFAMIANGLNADYNTNNITIAALSALYGKPFEVPQFSKVTTEDLDAYLGNYTSKEIPLKITISKEGTSLFAVVEGQGTRPLTAAGKHRFTDDAVGVVVVFNPESKNFVLSQRGLSFTFTKNP